MGRLLREQKLGALVALLGNLRNMHDEKVDETRAFAALKEMKTARVLPFRFVAAARYAPHWETPLEQAMLSGVGDQLRLKGKTVQLVDVLGQHGCASVAKS